MMLLGRLLEWIVGSMLGRIAAGIAIGLVALGLNNAWQRHKGASQIVAQSIEQGKRINEKNRKIREKVKAPGAAERVLRNYCRDC